MPMNKKWLMKNNLSWCPKILDHYTTRLKILNSVCKGEKSVGEIVTAVDSTQANISRQINLLYRGKILARRKEGTQVFYRIEDQKTLTMCQSVCSEIADRLGIEGDLMTM